MIRFGIFEVDLEAGELRRKGYRVDVEPQPFQLLAILLERAGKVVTREELRQKLWPTDTNVDFVSGLNRAMGRVREALRDSAESQRFIETLPKKGYRFIAEISRGPRIAQDPPPREPPPSSARPTRSGPGVNPSSPPYVGPQPFSADQFHRFFGRSSERDELVNLIEADAARRVIMIYSQSGGGKTSLLNTAVRMALASKGYEVLPLARLGLMLPHPTENQNLYTAAAIASMGKEISPDLAIGAGSWSAFLASMPNREAGKVLIIDQLEEIVTTQLGPPREKREFFVDLLSAIEAHPSLRVVFALREDFLPEIERLTTDLEPYSSKFLLERLRLESAREAIIRPAEADGVGFDEDVVKALVEELARVRYKDRLSQAFDIPGDFVEPLHLQIVCQALWARLPAKIKRISWNEIVHAIPATARSKTDPMQPQSAITAFVHSALAGFCEKIIAAVAEETGVPIELIELGCEQFILKNGTRALVHQQGDDVGALSTRVVEAMARRQLLHLEEDRRGERSYELAHDRLIEPVRARTQQVDTMSLQQLWLRLVRKIALDSSVDKTDLLHRFCRSFGNSSAATIRVSAKSLENEIPRSAMEAMCQVGLIRRASEQQETFYELSHPRLAVALYQIHTGMSRDPGPLYDIARIVFSSVASIIASISVVMVTRSILQGLHLTLTQATGDGFVNGSFQGVIGAIDWSVFIAGALSSWWFLVEHCETRRTSKQSWQAGIIGGVAGLLGGALVTANLLYAQSQNSLYEAGWILDRTQSPITAFTETGFASCMILFGIGLGLGSGLSTIRILRSSAWKTLVARFSNERSLSETVGAIVPVFIHIFRQSWYVLVLVMLPAVLINGRILSALSKPPGLSRVLGECVVISAGGEGIVAGLLFGIFALRTGFAIPALEGAPESR